MTTLNIGDEGFRWFIGTVEDLEDPEKTGRVKVRIQGIHPDQKTKVPTSALPWATILLPTSSASLKKVGSFATGMELGTTVVGFFMDGRDGNYPIILGTLAGKEKVGDDNTNDLPDEALGRSKIVKKQDGPEPPSASRAKYPYNKVIRSKSGHVIELDDTPDNERIHIYHKSGTYTEVNNKGRRVDKSVDDRIEISLKDYTIFVKGNINMSSEGSIVITAGSGQTILLDA